MYTLYSSLSLVSSLLISSILLTSSSSIFVSAATPACSDILNDLTPYNGECTDTWATLKPIVRPTQPQVGYAWVQYKLDKDFTSESNAQAELDASITPAILGPTNDTNIFAIYYVDDHHTYCALDASGYDTVTATLNIICDLRNETLDTFWTYLGSHNYSMLAMHPLDQPNSLPLPINYTDMPLSLSFIKGDRTLSDDPWRSLAGFSRKIKDAPSPAPSCSNYKYCERCFYRGCNDGSQSTGPSVPFFEFRWSYFMLSAYIDSTWWDSNKEYTTFVNSYETLPYPSTFGKIDTTAWLDTASLLIPLCRGDNTGNYLLPTNIFEGATTLPGYTQGYTELDADPTCDQPSNCITMY